MMMSVVCLCVCDQIYNEQVRDLMSPGGPLALRVDSAGDAVVAGLTVHKVSASISRLFLVLLLAANTKLENHHLT